MIKISYFKKEPLFNRVLKSFSWTLLGTIIARGLSLIALILVARILGVEEFGKYSILQNTIIMIGTFSGLGIGMTATKFIAEFRQNDSEKASRIIALCESLNVLTGLFFAIGTFFLSPFLSVQILADPSLEPLLKLCCIYLFLITVDSAQNGTIAGIEAFKPRAITQIITSILFIFFVVIGTLLWGIIGTVIALIFQGLSSCILNLFIIKVWSKKIGLEIKFDGMLKEIKGLLKFSLPVFASSLFIIPIEWFLSAILVKSANGFIEVGYINATKQWFIIITFLPMALANITLPVLSSLIGNNEHNKYGRVVIINTIIMTGVGVILAIPIFILSDFFIGFYGKDFIVASDVLKLTCIYAVLYCLNIIVGQVIWTNGFAIAGFLLSVFRSVVLVIGFMFLFEKTAIGLVQSYILSYIMLSIVQIILAIFMIKKLNKGKSNEKYRAQKVSTS
ncbi:oligosaccharide flippase family protein [Planococcus sp. N028]|uniref:Oligosaccharide flippase family protein n=1 Tax=Planococcus shixiaomingii TaxID=3058393 RepID=A0ABT8N1E2_9BACL|nr:oligosaccharide flippase family protein [Planococcus sp. N028]MDN7241712.1 oligosaccharide flippase family protein [Planococcus sp. N028]